MERILYAHRGASALEPENTLEAFARALADGAEAIETDVRLTRDGHAVVFHDATGARVCGVPAVLRRVDLAEVKRWSVRRPGHRVPTLEEALDAFPGVRFNVDLKLHEPAMAHAAIEAVRRCRAEERVLLTSLSSRMLRAVRRRGYRGPTGHAILDVLRILAGGRAQGVAVQMPWRLATRAAIERFHALGLRVDLFTVNDPARAARLLALGADGIMTDDPARIAPLFSRVVANTP